MHYIFTWYLRHFENANRKSKGAISHACGISWASRTTQNIDCTKIPMTYPSQITYSDLLRPFRKLLFARPSQCSVGLSCKGNTNPVITDIIIKVHTRAE